MKTEEVKARQSSLTTKLSGGTVLSYSFGDVANNLSFMMTSMFLMVYMTEIAGLSAGVGGAIYGITKIWAGATDLFVGQVGDRVNTRFGRLRPFLLFGSTPLVVVFVLLFSAPAGLGPTGTLAWIFLLDALFQLCYSFVNIPYGSLASAMTQDPIDRSRLSGARSIASSATGVLLAMVVAPQFGDTQAEGVRLKFTITCAILGLIALVLYLICFKNCKEVVPKAPGKMSMKDTFKVLRSNKPLLVLCLGAFFLLASMFTMNAVGMYFAKYVLGNSGWYVFLTLAQTVGTVAVASIVPTITARLGKRSGYVASAAVVVVAFVLVFFVPSAGLNDESANISGLVIALIAWLLFGLGSGGTNALMFSMQADTVDYGEWKAGIRSEAGSYSILSFIRKCGQGIGGWAGGAIIAAFGYSATTAGMSSAEFDNMTFGIRVACGLAPAALAIVAGLIMMRYPLSADEHASVVAELTERRTLSALAETHGVDEEELLVVSMGDGRTTKIRPSSKLHLPVVTVFGNAGSGASKIGPMLADALDVPYLGQRFSAEEIADMDSRQLMTDSGFDRWLRRVNYSGAQDATSAAGENAETDFMAAQNNTRQLLKFVENGGVVLGRNGAFVLGRAVGSLHIRLVAPKGKRIERIATRHNLSPSDAEIQLDIEDRIRAEMSHHLYQWDPNSDEYYDMVINTGSMTYDRVVKMIVDLYVGKYPEAKDHVNADRVDDIEQPDTE